MTPDVLAQLDRGHALLRDLVRAAAVHAPDCGARPAGLCPGKPVGEEIARLPHGLMGRALMVAVAQLALGEVGRDGDQP